MQIKQSLRCKNLTIIFLTLFLWELMFWFSNNKHYKRASGGKSVYSGVPLLFPCMFFLSLSSLQKSVHCTFSNNKLTSDNELEIFHYFMQLEATVVSTAVNLGALACSKINRTRRKHDKSH